ncbi:MAG: hypothetical protein J6M10_01795 [Clostridia bacterium]|nr:hypothetical protein [Clostridia bacterium]
MGIKDSGERTAFGTGAVRDMHAGKGRFDLLPWHAIHDVAKHCEEGALKYGERNVDKGIPQHSFIDSAFWHLKNYWTGETDEHHLRAAAWNILWALEQETTHPDLIDLPGREKPTHLEELRAKMREAMEKTFPPSQRARECVYPVTYFTYIHDMGDHFVGITHAGDEAILPKQTDEGGA